MEKNKFYGLILGVQPRIRLIRSFDQANHNYLGYNIFLHGTVDNEERDFCVAVGKGAQEKNRFSAGQTIIGQCLPVINREIEVAEFYKASSLKKIKDDRLKMEPPPYIELPLKLEEYRARGHRRLSSKSYSTKCRYCHWACQMPTEIQVDQWNPQSMKYRFETFCYGPKSCTLYNSGPTRKVPGRNGMIWEEENWVDEQNTAHRRPDE